MSTGGDYPDEMFRRPLDDEAIDSLLAGRPPAGLESLVAFVEDVHLAAAVSVPEPTVALAAVFAAGLSTEKGDLPVTAAGNVPGPASQVAGLPKRSKTVIEVLLAKLAAAGLVAKTGLAAGALTLGATAAAATGNLPEPAQDRVADAVEHVGLNIPGGSEKADEHRRDADHRQEGEVADTDGAGTDVAETPAEADFGTGVADRATGGAPREDGRGFGETVSDDARSTFQPEGTPTAGDNPGTGYRESAPVPEGTPTAGDNPGTGHRESAPVPEGTPTAGDNPGTGYRESAPVPVQPPARGRP